MDESTLLAIVLFQSTVSFTAFLAAAWAESVEKDNNDNESDSTPTLHPKKSSFNHRQALDCIYNDQVCIQLITNISSISVAIALKELLSI